MPQVETPPVNRSSAREEADREERSSGKDEGDRVEGDAHAKAEEAERDSGSASTQA